MTRGDDHSDWSQDPIVERGRPDPAEPPEKTLTLVGFRGDSDREGYRRLYFTHDLDYYAEFRDEDVLHTAAIPADALPFPGEEATRVTIRRDARIEYTRTRTGRPLDEFDLDVRFFGRGRFANWRRITDTCDFTCEATCHPHKGTCVTCDALRATCETCPNQESCICKIPPPRI